MRIAITGGIGVGKSEVMKMIKDLGYDVASADLINAELLKNPEYIAKIKAAFPTAVKDGAVDKSALRKVIFNDYEKRQLLNSIAHPEIRKEIAKFQSDVFVEIPLLYESGMQNLFDKVIVVTAPYDIRVARLFDRSGIDRELAKKMISSQISDSERKKYADFVIENKASKDDLYVKVRDAIAALL